MASRKTTLILAAAVGLLVVAGVVVAVVSVLPAQATSHAVPPVKSPYFKENTNRSLGRYLTDADGLTLYTYGRSGAGRYRGACGRQWSAYGPDAGDNSSDSLAKLPVDIGVARYPDGRLRFIWKGLPVYRCGIDKAKGDAKGADDYWRVIKL